MSSVSKSTPLDKTTLKGSVYADVDHDPVTTVLPNGDVPYTDHAMDADERVIEVVLR